MTNTTDEIVIYKSEDGAIKLDVLFSEEKVWLTQAQMSELFQRDRTVITKHISNVFQEEELAEESNVHFLHIANSDKPVEFDRFRNVALQIKIAAPHVFCTNIVV